MFETLGDRRTDLTAAARIKTGPVYAHYNIITCVRMMMILMIIMNVSCIYIHSASASRCGTPLEMSVARTEKSRHKLVRDPQVFRGWYVRIHNIIYIYRRGYIILETVIYLCVSYVFTVCKYATFHR